MLQGDLSLVSEELDQLSEAVYHIKNKDDIYSIINSACNINDFYLMINDKAPRNFTNFFKNQYLWQLTNQKRNQIIDNYFNNFIENKDFHEFYSLLNISFLNPSYKMFIDDEVDLQIELESKKKRSLSDKERLEILSDFFQEEGHSKLFSKMLDEKRIFYNKMDQDRCGCCVRNLISNTYWILMNNGDIDEFDVEALVSLVHEFGHIIDFSQLSKFSRDSFYEVRSVYTEVISRRYEKKILDYLVKNNILMKDTYALYASYYNDVYSYLYELAFFTNMKDSIINKRKIPDDSEIVLEEDAYPEFFKLSPSDLEDFSLVNSLIYGYGGTLAIYFEFLEHENKVLYEKYYSRFLESRNQFFNPNILESFLEKDVLKEAISSDVSKVKEIRKIVKKI